MRATLLSLSLLFGISTVISDDTSLFSDLEPYPYDSAFSDEQTFWTDDSQLGTDYPLLGDSMFDETSPQMLSFDGCSSGDLGFTGDFGFTGKIRRGDSCRPDTSSGTEGSIQAPPSYPDPEERPPDDQGDDSPDALKPLPYMPPPAFDGLGCSNLVNGFLTYTVCGNGNSKDSTPSESSYVQFPSFNVMNAELSK